MNYARMRLSNLTSTVLILTSFFCVHSAPAKPLNERSTELTWQAWLLVDDQNQNKQYDAEGLLRRRITPKSIFIAPTFSPENLPACAEGYTSDSMGRCIKIIQIDTEGHLDFILDRLKEQFGNIDEDYEYDLEEMQPTSGPLQLNIPLDQEKKKDDDEEKTNVAIVVAPTNGHFNFSTPVVKVNNVKRDDNSTGVVDAPVIVTRISIEGEANEIATTTEATATEATTIFEPTTTDFVAETTMVEDGGETTTDAATTTLEPQAIFFKVPTANNKTNEDMMASENKPTFVRFPEDESNTDLQKTQHIISQLLPHAKVKTKFDALEEFIDFEQTHSYKNRDTQHQSTESNVPKVYNHRNRDKHWHFPPTWRDIPPHKPLVLKFNNLPNTNNHHLYHYPRQEVYREVPSEEFSYIFGSKRAASMAHS